MGVFESRLLTLRRGGSMMGEVPYHLIKTCYILVKNNKYSSLNEMTFGNRHSSEFKDVSVGHQVSECVIIRQTELCDFT